MNIYIELTTQFNMGRKRAILSSGQAVVLHRLAMMSKDGDWILAEDVEALAFVLEILWQRGAQYRFGAPLDIRWLRGGWSAHLEFRTPELRVRTDFVTRPPRLTEQDLVELWKYSQTAELPFVGVLPLIQLKMTKREKDYPIIGELARCLENTEEQFLYSRSARDLLRLADEYPEIVRQLQSKRTVLRFCSEGKSVLEQALDAERRERMQADEIRLERYERAASDWKAFWPTLSKVVSPLPLHEAHNAIVQKALSLLPFEVSLS